MAGVKGQRGGGGARPNAGRKASATASDLQSALGQAASVSDRSAIFQKLATNAKAGDVGAARLFLAYAYGTPPSGDDLAVQERVNKIVNDFYNRLAPHFGDGKAREILALIAGDATVDGEEDARAEVEDERGHGEGK